MAGEIQAQFPTGATIYAILLDANGAVWNGSAFDATPTVGEWCTYDIAMPEDGTAGLYRGDLPAVPAQILTYQARKQIGGSPASTDPTVWTGEIDTRITGLLRTKAEADAAHALLATSAALVIAQADLDELQSRLPSDPADASVVAGQITAAQGVVTTAIGALNNLSQAQAQTAAAAALTAYDPPTHAELTAELAASDAATQAAVAASEAALTALLGALALITVPQIWSGLTVSALNRIADHVLRRTQANAQASADGDAITDAGSLWGIGQQHRRANTVDNAGMITVYDPSGVELEQIPLAAIANSDDIVGVG